MIPSSAIFELDLFYYTKLFIISLVVFGNFFLLATLELQVSTFAISVVPQPSSHLSLQPLSEAVIIFIINYGGCSMLGFFFNSSLFMLWIPKCLTRSCTTVILLYRGHLIVQFSKMPQSYLTCWQRSMKTCSSVWISKTHSICGPLAAGNDIAQYFIPIYTFFLSQARPHEQIDEIFNKFKTITTS